MARSRCIIVALEGLDATGKTTAATGLQRELRREGISAVIRHSESHYLVSAFQHAKRNNDPQFKYLLQACAARLLAEEIAASPRDSIFICDRYFVSARAYYLVRWAGADLINPAIKLLPEPDVAVLLECSTQIRNARLIKRKPRPSHRKLHTTEQAFCGLMEELMLAAYPWVRIDTELLSKSETVARIREAMMEVTRR